MQLTGIHHVTAITANAPRNHAFYTGVLGMRLVKKTVNQDDTSAYHLFYADAVATPGTDITFFDWPMASERRGTHSIVRIGFRVASNASLNWWLERFEKLGVLHSHIVTRDGRNTIDFEDPEGQRLSLVHDVGQSDAQPWEKSPVPAEHQIRGLGPIALSVPELERTGWVLAEVLSMRRVRQYTFGEAETAVFEMGSGGPGAEVHVLTEPNTRPSRPGSGAVHHLALRAPNTKEYRAWIDRLTSYRIASSGAVDRYYFQSVYFREPNGILFEIATDGPGFATDEPVESLGEQLALPPFLEHERAQIEAGLKPLETSARSH